MNKNLEIPYLICLVCETIESTPYDEGDSCICGGKFVLATDFLTTLKSRQAALIEKLRGRLVIGHKQIEDIIKFLEGKDEKEI